MMIAERLDSGDNWVSVASVRTFHIALLGVGRSVPDGAPDGVKMAENSFQWQTSLRIEMIIWVT